MIIEKQKATAAAATQKKNIQQNESYRQEQTQSTEKYRAERIRKHRVDIPRQYRKVYDMAMTGRSLRVAVNSQCIECMGYDFSEVKICCSSQCPLFPYRPLRGVSYGVSDVGQSSVESTNSDVGGPKHG